MLNRNNINKTVVFFLSACALLACVEMELPQPAEVGYLDAPKLEVDVVVEDLTQTKAIDFNIEAPAHSEMHFIVKDKDGKVKYDADGLWTEPLVLPVGTYSIEAYAGENGFGAPYFMGKASGTIGVLSDEVPVLSVSLANSLVNVTVSDELAEHFTPERIILNGDAYEAAYGQWFYVPSGADLVLSLEGKNSADRKTTLSYTLKSPSPKAAYRLTCGQETTDWPAITLSLNANDVWASRIFITTPASFSGNISAENQAAVVYEAIPSSSSDWSAPAKAVSENGVHVIKGLTPKTEYQVRARVGALVSPVVKVTPQVDGFSVTSAHTFTSGELDGTDVISTFAKSTAVKNAIQSWKIDVCKADGTVLRSEKSIGTSDGSAITSTTGWPYLPVGGQEQYIVKASATIDGETFDFTDLALAVPSTPDFSLALSAYTSYDKYAATNGITRDLNGERGANNCNPSLLYNAGASWNISTNLMKNTNYLKTIAIYIDGDASGRTSTVDSWDYNYFYQDITLGWASHTHQVAFTFDGKTVTSGRNTHHVTGLPHRAAPPTTSNGWSAVNGNISWEGDRVNMYYSAAKYPKIKSPAFYLPGNVNVQVQPDIRRNDFNIGKPKLQISLTDTNTSDLYYSGLDANESYTSSINAVMESSGNTNGYFTIEYEYAASGIRTYVYKFDVLYR
ncbi:MAG: DUF4493 domain-containing protein [Bacteroidales bacterium]|nr:DUF4493 domain-containing protein [Bacteroidales bacterium]